MRARVEHFMAFFVKTFLLVNFIAGSLAYIFTADRVSPGLKPSTMLWIALAIAIIGAVSVLRQP